MTVGKTVNLNEEKEEEEGNDSVSQLTGLESVRQSIPPLRFRLAAGGFNGTEHHRQHQVINSAELL